MPGKTKTPSFWGKAKVSIMPKELKDVPKPQDEFLDTKPSKITTAVRAMFEKPKPSMSFTFLSLAVESDLSRTFISNKLSTPNPIPPNLPSENEPIIPPSYCEKRKVRPVVSICVV